MAERQNKDLPVGQYERGCCGASPAFDLCLINQREVETKPPDSRSNALSTKKPMLNTRNE